MRVPRLFVHFANTSDTDILRTVVFCARNDRACSTYGVLQYHLADAKKHLLASDSSRCCRPPENTPHKWNQKICTHSSCVREGTRKTHGTGAGGTLKSLAQNPRNPLGKCSGALSACLRQAGCDRTWRGRCVSLCRQASRSPNSRHQRAPLRCSSIFFHDSAAEHARAYPTRAAYKQDDGPSQTRACHSRPRRTQRAASRGSVQGCPVVEEVSHRRPPMASSGGNRHPRTTRRTRRTRRTTRTRTRTRRRKVCGRRREGRPLGGGDLRRTPPASPPPRDRSCAQRLSETRTRTHERAREKHAVLQSIQRYW